MPPGPELEGCCCSNRGQSKGKKGREGGEFVRWHPDRMPGAPKWFLPLGLLCPSSNGAAVYHAARSPRRKQSERAAILLHWPQSPGSSQSILLSRPLSSCQPLSAPQSASQRTSSGKIGVAIQVLTFSHSLFFPLLIPF